MEIQIQEKAVNVECKKKSGKGDSDSLRDTAIKFMEKIREKTLHVYRFVVSEAGSSRELADRTMGKSHIFTTNCTQLLISSVISFIRSHATLQL